MLSLVSHRDRAGFSAKVSRSPSPVINWLTIRSGIKCSKSATFSPTPIKRSGQFRFARRYLKPHRLYRHRQTCLRSPPTNLVETDRTSDCVLTRHRIGNVKNLIEGWALFSSLLADPLTPYQLPNDLPYRLKWHHKVLLWLFSSHDWRCRPDFWFRLQNKDQSHWRSRVVSTVQ